MGLGTRIARMAWTVDTVQCDASLHYVEGKLVLDSGHALEDPSFVAQRDAVGAVEWQNDATRTWYYENLNRFLPGDGSAIALDTPGAVPVTSLQCRECGASLDGDALGCPKCGAWLFRRERARSERLRTERERAETLDALIRERDVLTEDLSRREEDRYSEIAREAAELQAGGVLGHIAQQCAVSHNEPSEYGIPDVQARLAEVRSRIAQLEAQ